MPSQPSLQTQGIPIAAKSQDFQPRGIQEAIQTVFDQNEKTFAEFSPETSREHRAAVNQLKRVIRAPVHVEEGNPIVMLVVSNPSMRSVASQISHGNQGTTPEITPEIMKARRTDDSTSPRGPLSAIVNPSVSEEFDGEFVKNQLESLVEDGNVLLTYEEFATVLALSPQTIPQNTTIVIGGNDLGNKERLLVYRSGDLEAVWSYELVGETVCVPLCGDRFGSN